MGMFTYATGYGGAAGPGGFQVHAGSDDNGYAWQNNMQGRQQAFQREQMGMQNNQFNAQLGQREREMMQQGALGKQGLANQMAQARMQQGTALRGYANQVTLEGMRGDTQRGIAGMQAGTASEGFKNALDQEKLRDANNISIQNLRGASDLDVARVQADASKYPATLHNDQFNKALGALGGSGEPLWDYQGPGSGVSAAPIWNEQQIQQQVNSAKASGDMATQGRMRAMQGEMAGRGAGSQSPLMMALQNAAMGQNLAGNVANETGIRWDAAKGNAEQVQRGQIAQDAAIGNQEQAKIGRAQVIAGKRNALMGAIAGLV